MKKNGILRTRGREKRWLLLGMALAGLCGSCSDDEGGGGSPYDPDLPVTLNSFMPDSGGIRTNMVITGSNFGSDVSNIRVLFSDRNKSATVINANNEAIYCLVPKQDGGDNSVKVVIGTDTTAFSETFRYTVTESVSTISGVQGDNSCTDGSLSDARFNYLYGVAAVTNGDIIVCEMYSGNIRYVAVNDDAVSTLQTGFYGGNPARTADRSKIYSIQYTNPHKVYEYDEANLWEPQLLVSSISEFTGTIWSSALDSEEKWLYFFDSSGKFGRLEIANPSNVEVLNEKIPMGNGSNSCLAYSVYDDCFFYTTYSTHSVYRLSKDGQNYELYIGGNGGGTTTGDRLEDAKLYYPGGLTVDEDGNIYVVNIDGDSVEKCDRKSGYVSLVAGVPQTAGHADGDPLEAEFYLPFGISIDEDGNFIICECWASGVIRKLAIE